MKLLGLTLGHNFFLETSALLDVRNCPKLQYCAISTKTNDVNLRKWWKSKFQAQFWTNFGFNFGPYLGPNIFFVSFIPLLDFRHCCKLSMYAISRKTKVQNLRKWQKKLIPGLILARLVQIWVPNIFFHGLLPLLYVRHCCKLSLYAISKKTNDPNSRKLRRTSFWAWFRPVGPKFGRWFFFKNLASSDTRYHCQLSLCIILGKTNDPFLRKLTNGWMDGQKYRRTRVISQDTVPLTSSVQYKNYKKLCFFAKKIQIRYQANMASNERNHRETEKEIQLSTKSYKS